MVILHPYQIAIGQLELEHRIGKGLVGVLVRLPLQLGDGGLAVEHREGDVVQQRPQHVVAEAVVVQIGRLRVHCHNRSPKRYTESTQ